MSVRSVRQMNDSPDGAPAGATEPAPEQPHSWLAALRARLGLPGAPTLRAMLEDALKGAGDGRTFSAAERQMLPCILHLAGLRGRYDTMPRDKILASAETA